MLTKLKPCYDLLITRISENGLEVDDVACGIDRGEAQESWLGSSIKV
jgi:orotate phosphoribosyltransferase